MPLSLASNTTINIEECQFMVGRFYLLIKREKNTSSFDRLMRSFRGHKLIVVRVDFDRRSIISIFFLIVPDKGLHYQVNRL